MFGGCDNGITCFESSMNTVCNEDEETGLTDTCIPDLVDFSTLTFGNGTYIKGNLCYLITKHLKFPYLMGLTIYNYTCTS